MFQTDMNRRERMHATEGARLMAQSLNTFSDQLLAEDDEAALSSFVLSVLVWKSFYDIMIPILKEADEVRRAAKLIPDGI